MFEFTEIANVQQQIAALTEQLNKLTNSIAPYQEAQNAATELVAKVEEHRHAMEEKGLAQQSLNKWAAALYEAGCGRALDVATTDKDLEIAALKASLKEFTDIGFKVLEYEQKIQELESERAVLQKEIANLVESSNKTVNSDKLEDLERELFNCRGRNERLEFELKKLEESLTASDAKEPLYTLGEKLDQGIEARSKILTSGDVVQLLDGRVATVTGFDGEGNVEVRLPNGKSADYARADLRWISSEQEISPPATVDNVEVETVAEDPTKKYQDFLAAITRNPKQWENLNWVQIRNLVDCQAEGFKELGLAVTTKAQRDKRAILMNERIAKLLADHIKEYGDRSDFEWIPSHLKNQVIEILEKKEEVLEKGALVQIGDEVEWEVVSHDTATNQVLIVNHDTGIERTVGIDLIKSVAAPLINF